MKILFFSSLLLLTTSLFAESKVLTPMDKEDYKKILEPLDKEDYKKILEPLENEDYKKILEPLDKKGYRKTIGTPLENKGRVLFGAGTIQEAPEPVLKQEIKKDIDLGPDRDAILEQKERFDEDINVNSLSVEIKESSVKPLDVIDLKGGDE